MSLYTSHGVPSLLRVAATTSRERDVASRDGKKERTDATLSSACSIGLWLEERTLFMAQRRGASAKDRIIARLKLDFIPATEEGAERQKKRQQEEEMR